MCIAKNMPKLIIKIKNLIFGEEFRKKHRVLPQDFSRNRKLPFPMLISLLINLRKCSYQTELNGLYKAVHRLDVPKNEIRKDVLTKAREKLKCSAFVELNETLVASYEAELPLKTWRGHRLLAVDGTTLTVPSVPEIAEHFGVWSGGENGTPCPKARASQLFDVLNNLTVDARLAPKGESERELASFHFLKLMPNDLVLLDRGYPAFWLFKLIQIREADFCARVSTSQWNVVKKFLESNEMEAVVDLEPSPESRAKCLEIGIGTEPMTVRLIRVSLKNGETEVLMTSLLDPEKYPIGLFASLYHKRWPVEEDYKVWKHRINIENFSGKTVHSVYQDFHALIFAKNLSAIFANSVQEIIDNNTANRKYAYKINLAHVFSVMKNSIALLFLRSEKAINGIVSAIRSAIHDVVERIRPDRSLPRNHKIRQRRFYISYKQLP